MAKIKMTTEEAFVKVLQMHGIEHAFGIIGSAFMPISDLFPKAGITFWDVGHEGNAGMMADGFTREVVGANGDGRTPSLGEVPLGVRDPRTGIDGVAELLVS